MHHCCIIAAYCITAASLLHHCCMLYYCCIIAAIFLGAHACHVALAAACKQWVAAAFDAALACRKCSRTRMELLHRCCIITASMLFYFVMHLHAPLHLLPHARNAMMHHCYCFVLLQMQMLAPNHNDDAWHVHCIFVYI
jgi:hypothetical protein